jgi:pimeloyl-ACP methyl ester carboxylesterase
MSFATAMRGIGAALAALLIASTPSRAQSRPELGSFDPVAVVDGIRIDRSACAEWEKNDTAIWVEVDGTSACLRYYAAGLAPSGGSNPIAALWLNGDVLGPNGKNAEKRQKGFGPTEMVALERRLFERYRVPTLFLGRPGTYGSAGKHHATRGRPLEARLIDAAMDGLAERYHIGAWSLGGHSGGGTLVAEMLARRSDLRCAVISSGASAYRAYLQARDLIRSGEPLTRFDPYDALDRVPTDPNRRIFVIGDPRETNVPFSAQKLYFDGLVSRGHAAWLVPLERASDARHHDLVDFGETATEMCATGAGTDAILETLKSMPEPSPRRTN